MPELNEKVPVFGGVTRMKKAMSLLRTDAWQNPFTGFGTDRDKATATTFAADTRLSDDQLEALYNGEDMAATIADTVPDEMLRQGYSVKIDVSDESDDIDEEAARANETANAVKEAAKAMNTQGKFIEAETWARVFGGAGIYLGCDDGARDNELALPLDEKRITTFDHMNVLDKRYLVPLKWYSDPTAPKFGYPATYLVTPDAVPTAALAEFNANDIDKKRSAFTGAVEVHESRMVIFGGVRTTTRERQRNNGWHRSLLQRCHTVLQQFGIGWSALTHILQDANVGVFKMDGLIEALAQSELATIQTRLELVDMAKSNARSVVIDRETEEYARENFNWSGIDKPYIMLMLRLSACARIPVTILMGQSPAGMDATGDSDIRWFYDTIRTKRENELDPKLRRVHELIMLSKSGPTKGKVPDSWSLQYPSLWQMTPKEEAEIRELQSRTDNVYLTNGVLLPEEVALSRFRPDGWSGETTIDTAARVHILESGTEEALEDEPDIDTDTDTDGGE